MTRTAYLIIVLLFLNSFLVAQEKKGVTEDDGDNIIIDIKPRLKKANEDDIRFMLLQSILKGDFLDSMKALPTNEAHLISIAISFDATGSVDSIYFSSKMTPRLKKFLGSSEGFKTTMKKSISKFNNFKDVVILFPVLFHYMDHSMINKWIFIDDYINLWPSLSEKDSMKKIIFLEPYIQGIRFRNG